jgi:hypothetical protein
MSKTITITQLGTRELWDVFSRNPLHVYKDTADKMAAAGMDEGLSLSRVLEVLSPSEKGDELDTFGRMMQEAGIRTKSNPAAGWWASKAEVFLKDQGARALLREFAAREWRKVSMRDVSFLSDDVALGTIMRPWVEGGAPRWSEQMAPAIPLTELVAITTPVDGAEYKSLYLDFDSDEARMVRVAEATDIPLASLRTREKPVYLHKYGRGILSSYEALRRLRVDRLAWFIQSMAIQAETDKVVAALDVAINGDGNAGTAAEVIALTTLDPDAAPGTLTLKAWLAFKMQFKAPYTLTHALMREDVALQLALLNTGSANIPLSTVNIANLGTMLSPINAFADGVRYGWTDEAPANKIVGYDRRWAIERATEVGSVISESERFILNQTQALTMTEVEGYAVYDSHAVKILDLSS